MGLGTVSAKSHIYQISVAQLVPPTRPRLVPRSAPVAGRLGEGWPAPREGWPAARSPRPPVPTPREEGCGPVYVTPDPAPSSAPASSPDPDPALEPRLLTPRFRLRLTDSPPGPRPPGGLF